VIIKNATLTMDMGTGAEDFSDHLIMANVDSPASAVDDRTFGNPYASDTVVGAESITITFKWSDTLMGLLTGHEDTDIDLVLTPVSGGSTITATVQFHKLPMGTFQIGEKVETDLVLAVIDEISYS
jgi:hypothetical protein